MTVSKWFLTFSILLLRRLLYVRAGSTVLATYQRSCVCKSLNNDTKIQVMYGVIEVMVCAG